MLDMSSANVSGDYTVGTTTVKGGVNRGVGQVGTITPAEVVNMQLVEFQNILGDVPLNTDPATDTGDQLITAIKTLIQTTVDETREVLSPIGSMVWYTGKGPLAHIPAGFVIADGTVMPTVAYPQLAELYAGLHGNPLVVGDTFKLPNMLDRFVKGVVSTVGDLGGSNTTTITHQNLPHDIMYSIPNTTGNWKATGDEDRISNAQADGTPSGIAMDTTPLNMGLIPIIRARYSNEVPSS